MPMIAPTLVAAITWLITGASPRWVGCRPEAGQRVYFANHTSHLDAVALWTALPSALRATTRPVAAKDYWSAGRIRRYLAVQVLHAVLIERTHVTARHNPLTPLLDALDQGHSLILFPEGTRTRGCEAGTFKCGLYHLARRRPTVELVPVFIDNLNRVLPKGELLPVPLVSCITFGTPMHLEGGESRPAFLERARRAVNQLRAP